MRRLTLSLSNFAIFANFAVSSHLCTIQLLSCAVKESSTMIRIFPREIFSFCLVKIVLFWTENLRRIDIFSYLSVSPHQLKSRMQTRKPETGQSTEDNALSVTGLCLLSRCYC